MLLSPMYHLHYPNVTQTVRLYQNTSGEKFFHWHSPICLDSVKGCLLTQLTSEEIPFYPRKSFHHKTSHPIINMFAWSFFPHMFQVISSKRCKYSTSGVLISVGTNQITFWKKWLVASTLFNSSCQHALQCSVCETDFVQDWCSLLYKLNSLMHNWALDYIKHLLHQTLFLLTFAIFALWKSCCFHAGEWKIESSAEHAWSPAEVGNVWYMSSNTTDFYFASSFVFYNTFLSKFCWKQKNQLVFV